MTTQLHPATDYRACVDPLHRNVWPVRVDEGDDAPVIGYLHEHITVALDGTAPPVTRWSWVFEDAEGDALHLDQSSRASRARYATWRKALEVFTVAHQLTVALRADEARRAQVGE